MRFIAEKISDIGQHLALRQNNDVTNPFMILKQVPSFMVVRPMVLEELTQREKQRGRETE